MILGNAIITGHYVQSIGVSFDGLKIYFDKFPKRILGSDVFVRIKDQNNKISCEIKLVAANNLSVMLPYLRNGSYVLYLLYRDLTKPQNLLPINHHCGFPILIQDSKISCLVPEYFENNKRKYLDMTEKYEQGHINSKNEFIPEELKKLAREITRYSFTYYEKILAIHDWVASNIHYDYDSLADGSYVTKYDAVLVAHTKKGVCSGYAELAQKLLKASGIKAFCMECYAKSQIDGSLEEAQNKVNHVLNFAHDGERWIMMDITWDSDNEYRNGKYLSRTGMGLYHNYFDCTLCYLSYTHLLA